VLGVKKDAKASDIKKAYYQVCLPLVCTTILGADGAAREEMAPGLEL
jgi:hypothetical protein